MSILSDILGVYILLVCVFALLDAKTHTPSWVLVSLACIAYAMANDLASYAYYPHGTPFAIRIALTLALTRYLCIRFTVGTYTFPPLIHQS
jgi:uncharacterized membrane protein YccC